MTSTVYQRNTQTRVRTFLKLWLYTRAARAAAEGPQGGTGEQERNEEVRQAGDDEERVNRLVDMERVRRMAYHLWLYSKLPYIRL